MTKFFVSRQDYWGVDDPLVVEIAGGGTDYANADMLADTTDGRYRKLGCDQEYTNPIDALKAAFRVRRAWEKALREVGDDSLVRIEVGYTGGNTIPFEEYPSNADLYRWAKERQEKMPRCDQCGELIDGETWHSFDDPELGTFCSEYCLDQYIEAEEQAEWDAADVVIVVEGGVASVEKSPDNITVLIVDRDI